MSNFNITSAEDIINNTIPSMHIVVALSLMVNVCCSRDEIQDLDAALRRLSLIRQDINVVANHELIDVCETLLASTDVGVTLSEHGIYQKMHEKISAVDRWMRMVYSPVVEEVEETK